MANDAYLHEPCTTPEHHDQSMWGHWCWGRWRAKRPQPWFDSPIFGYVGTAKALIVDFELGDPDDESLVTEVGQEIGEAILDLGAQLKKERADDARAKTRITSPRPTGRATATIGTIGARQRGELVPRRS